MIITSGEVNFGDHQSNQTDKLKVKVVPCTQNTHSNTNLQTHWQIERFVERYGRVLEIHEHLKSHRNSARPHVCNTITGH